MKRIIYHSLFASMVLALVACGPQEEKKSLPNTKDTIPVTVIPLQPIGKDANIEATGVFTTEDETMLGFKNGGVIARIFVKEGDPIRRGQVLASIQANEIDAKAGQVNLSIEKAKRDYERVHRLYLDSVATLEQVQNAKTALELAKQDHKSIAFNQEYSKIVAPSNGYVLAKLANEGQVVGPGTPILQVNGAEDVDWILKVGVSDQQWTQIQVGDKATIQTDALPNQDVEAYVYKKSQGLDPRSGTFAIYIKLRNKSKNLASGVFGKSTIYLKGGENTKQEWNVPYESILEGNGREGYLFVTEDLKTAKKIKVQLSRIDNDYAVISSGLEHVKAIIEKGSAYLVDGSPIIIKSTSKK